MTYVIGVDSSTTATKAVVWDRDGRAVGEARQAFGLRLPRAGWQEQDAEDWWRSTRAALREAATTVDASEIEAIGITIQRETFACVDEDGAALRPAIVWGDTRAAREVEQHGSEEIHRITGKPPDTTPALYKILWLRAHDPRTLEHAARVVDVLAFLVRRLTGEWRTTAACADPLGLVDLATFDWSDAVLAVAGLERGQLPQLAPPGTVMGGLRAAVAAEVGLPPGIPVVGGAGDGQSAGLGAGVVGAGAAYLNLGTAVIAGTVSDTYAWAREFRTLAGGIPGTYAFETLLQGGTATVSWFVNSLLDAGSGRDARLLGLDLRPEDVLEVAAARLEPGAGGLLLLPYWTQSQTPHWDSGARGVILGLGGHHGRAHIYRAILEGIAFEQRLMTDAMAKRLEQPVEAFLTMGGGSRSALWCQIIADVTGRPVTTCRDPETTSLGAAMHAAAAVGWYDSIGEAAEGMSGQSTAYEPREPAATRYAALFDVYRDLYPRLAELFPRLGDASEAT